MGNKTSEIIYEQRKQKYLTQEQLAQEIGVSSVAVSKWERGISIPDQDTLCRLADYFKITVDELLGRKTGTIEENDVYTKEFMTRLHFGKILLNCYEISRKEGVLYWWRYQAVSGRKRRNDGSAAKNVKGIRKFFAEIK